MQDYVIFTDSSCDLTHQMVKQLSLTVVPLSVTMENKSYYNYSDNRELDPKDFYETLRRGVMATTNAVNVGQAMEAMMPVLASGKDILILAFSSGLSATYNSFQIAAQDLQPQFPQRKIFVVDTLCAASGQGLLVYLASKRRAEGMSIVRVRNWVEANKSNICHWVTVNDLMHLKRGGRVSATSAAMGSLLAIKPLIHMTVEGKLETVGKTRGRKATLATLLGKVKALPNIPDTVFIGHADNPEDAYYLAHHLQEMGVDYVEIGYIGPVIGAHTGPSCVVISFLGEKR